MQLIFKKQNLFFLLLPLLYCVKVNASPTRRVADTLPPSAFIFNDLQGAATVQNLENVEATIQEVEKLLQDDTSLPRLTRGEILEIIENLTSSDLQQTREPKAVMVVMPYSVDNVINGDVQALYTKPPRTQIINEVASSTEAFTMKRPTKKAYTSDNVDYSSFKIPIITTSTEITFLQNEQKNEHQELLESALQVETQKTRPTTQNPFTSFINRRRKPTKLPSSMKQDVESSTLPSVSSTTSSVVQKITRRRKVTGTPTNSPRPPTPPQSPSIPKRPPAIFHESGIVIVDPPKFNNSPEKNVIAFKPLPTRATITQKPIFVTQPSTTTGKPTPMIVDEVQIPEDFKDVLKSLDILIKHSPTEAPSPTTLDYSPELSEEEKLKLLFASLGGEHSSFITSTTTTTAEPDVVQVANNLTPEMQELLRTFGLIPDPNKDKTTTPKPEIFMEPSSLIKPESYTSFKPLPGSSAGVQNNDMEDLLAKFGLLGSGVGIQSQRDPKSISNLGNPSNNVMSIVPDKFKDVMEDIGLRNPPVGEEPERVVIPQDSETSDVTQEEINRLNQLMTVVQQFEKLNGSANDEDLKHIDLDGLKDLLQSFNVPLNEQNGPSPIDYDLNVTKNEVKRQTSTISPPMNEESKTTLLTSTETPAEGDNSSFTLLQESFGGSSDTVPDETIPSSESPPRTGFYYLVDWNSFFDIDNQKGKRVNLRFQPKIGDPKRFLSVSVP